MEWKKKDTYVLARRASGQYRRVYYITSEGKGALKQAKKVRELFGKCSKNRRGNNNKEMALQGDQVAFL
jgi:hypothetical protein